MKVFILAFFYFLIVGASNFKNEELNPAVKGPVMPATQTEIEELNPSVNPTPAENESDDFRGSTIQKQVPGDLEKKLQKTPKSEVNGKERKAL